MRRTRTTWPASPRSTNKGRTMTYARKRHHHTRLLVIAMLSLAIATAGCSSAGSATSITEPARIRLTGAYAEYSSIKALAEAADVIAVATAGAVARRVVEGDPDVPGTGIPMMYQKFSVDDVLFDPNGYVKSDTIYVSLFDTDKLIVDEQKDIGVGQRLLLFLDRVSADEVPAIRPLDQVFSPLSSDNGVFDVNDAGLITARSAAVKSLLPSMSAQGTESVVVGPDGEEKPAGSYHAFTGSLGQIEDVVATPPMDTTIVTSDIEDSALGPVMATWVNMLGLNQQDPDIWRSRLYEACTLGVWDKSVAVDLATRYIDEDASTSVRSEAMGPPSVENAANALWLMATQVCRDNFPDEAIAAGPPFPASG